MDDGSRLPLILTVILLLGAVYFALVETAFASASKTKLRAAAERGEDGAEQAVYVLNHFVLRFINFQFNEI